jgi:hypothetical protein
MSHSPWSGATLVGAIQAEVKGHSEFQAGAMLLLDESADEKAGEQSPGASRQHNGRLGKVDICQVGVFLSLATSRVNTWIDGELFLPERWFGAAYAERRKQAGIPETCSFQTKPELGWQMVQRAKANQVPFEAVTMDDLYGRNKTLRHRLDQAGIEYYGDVPANTVVYLDKPFNSSRWLKRWFHIKRYMRLTVGQTVSSVRDTPRAASVSTGDRAAMMPCTVICPTSPSRFSGKCTKTGSRNSSSLSFSSSPGNLSTIGFCGMLGMAPSSVVVGFLSTQAYHVGRTFSSPPRLMGNHQRGCIDNVPKPLA